MMKKDNDIAYWKELAERYFDCMTTDVEERQLMRFVAGNDDPDFDDVRAVMGYTISAKRRGRKPSENHRWWVAAACMVIIAGAATIYSQRDSDCIAYENGQLITDNQHVMEMMHSTVEMMVSHEAGESMVETQLSDMLGTLDDIE